MSKGCVFRGVCTSPLVDRMTDACENITFPQLLLWRVIKTEHSVELQHTGTNIRSQEEKWPLSKLDNPRHTFNSPSYD